MEVESLAQGAAVFEEGDRGDNMYVVVDGCVTLKVNGKVVASCTPFTERSWFGEMALVHSSTRTGSAACTEPTKLLSISAARFKILLELMPSLVDLFASNAGAMVHLNKLREKSAREGGASFSRKSSVSSPRKSLTPRAAVPR